MLPTNTGATPLQLVAKFRKPLATRANRELVGESYMTAE
jgi:hypothetical protein